MAADLTAPSGWGPPPCLKATPLPNCPTRPPSELALGFMGLVCRPPAASASHPWSHPGRFSRQWGWGHGLEIRQAQAEGQGRGVDSPRICTGTPNLRDPSWSSG